MSLLNIASVPAATVGFETSVRDAVRLMTQNRIGAVAVVKDERFCGIFTERDLMTRVVAEGLNPDSTAVQSVMTTVAEIAESDMSHGDALRIMVEKHVRHLPVLDRDRRVLGMLSIRNVLQHRVEDLSQQLDSVVSFFSADGIGG